MSESRKKNMVKKKNGVSNRLRGEKHRRVSAVCEVNLKVNSCDGKETVLKTEHETPRPSIMGGSRRRN